MTVLFCVILTFSLPLAISANIINGQECDVSKGEIWLQGTQEADFEACEKACKDNAECQSVTFYDHGACSLFATKCEKTKPVGNAHSELVKELGGLFGLECDSSKGEIWLAGTQEADFAACKKACEDNAQCQSITFYHHGGCSLFATKCENTKASAGAQSAVVKELSGKIGQECDVQQGEIYLSGSHEHDLAECKKACEDDAHCHSITFYRGGYCSLFGTTCDKMKANPAAQSALVREIEQPQLQQCEIDGTCRVAHGQECDRTQGESYMADGSAELSYEACKQACLDRVQCQSITYFPHGWCSLFKTQCQNRKPFKDALSVTLKADFFNKQECDTTKGEVLLSASSGDKADLEACRKSCEDAPACKSTTFFKSGYCSHYSTCCKNRKPSATGNADAVKTATCVDACVIENGGCDPRRHCTSTLGVATCGDCPAPLVNDGATECKERADPCKTNNGGCHSKRKCTSTNGQVTCGHCASGYFNDGAKGCKQDPCKKNNGGCHNKRRCTSKGSQVRCANCAGGLVNDGAKGCKAKPKPKPPAPKPTQVVFPVPSNYPAASCGKMQPKCAHITAAACNKPCSLKGGHSCCSYRIGGCHSCCAGGYLNDKCCPPGHGKCMPKPVPTKNMPSKDCAKIEPMCKHITEAACKKPCSLKGGHSCCSYRIGCHSCCSGGYLSDKCCPPGHGKCIDPCTKNNGGCHSKRKCTSKGPQVTCGNCAGGLVNDGAKGCKAKPKPKPKESELVFPYPSNYPAASCGKMKPKCAHITAAACNKPCSLKGGHSCCSYRIGGCHSCCSGGYLNDKCCPPGKGKCIDPRRKDCAKMEPKCAHITAAACNKPCSLKGGHSCCSYRIGGCHSCCLNGYLNDKCCPSGHGKCPAL